MKQEYCILVKTFFHINTNNPYQTPHQDTCNKKYTRNAKGCHKKTLFFILLQLSEAHLEAGMQHIT